MQWLNDITEELITRHPKGEIVVSSGVSPSGTYHLGTLREVMTAEAIAYDLKRRGRQSRHIHVVDDLDVLRKIPANVPASFQKYLGRPLCDVPAPEGKGSYADYYLNDLLEASRKLSLEMEIFRAHEHYRGGFFAEAIEKALAAQADIKKILETVSGHRLDESWSVVQVMEDGYLKNRQFISLDPAKKDLAFMDNNGKKRTVSYAKGSVKLNWRVDWPARWWLLGVNAEPFGRDHATKGGSYDTGVAIVEQVYGAPAPLPVPYNFVNMTGETKKMSKSAGNVVSAVELLKMLPAEVVWFFLLRYAPNKLLFFDQEATMIRLVDEFAELLAKPNKTDEKKQLVEMCLHGAKEPTVSNVPFSHLVASYQAALKDPQKTIDLLDRTQVDGLKKPDREVVKKQLKFIDEWLDKWAPEEVKFELAKSVNADKLNAKQKEFLSSLAAKIEKAPKNADGKWFHKTVYEFKAKDLEPKELFGSLYQILINKNAGPRAGWFLSILPRDWLIKRLRLQE